MDEYRENVKKVQKAVNQDAAFIRPNPYLAQRVLNAVNAESYGKGGIVTMKKRHVCTTLVVVMMLLSVTALAAVGLNWLYEHVIMQEGKSGHVRDWSVEEKIALIDIMVEVGIELDQDQVSYLHDEQEPEEERDLVAWEIISDYYPSRDSVLTSIDIMAKDKGPIETWSLEDRAWLSQMLAQYQPDEVRYGMNLLPNEEDISQQEAEDIFFRYYEDEYGLTQDDFDMETLTVSFGESTFSDGEETKTIRNWTLNVDVIKERVTSEVPVSESVGAHISSAGEIIDAYNPFMYNWRDEWYDDSMREDFWTVEGIYSTMLKWYPRVEQLKQDGENLYQDLSHFATIDFALPQGGDMSEDEAILIASGAVQSELGLSSEEMQYYTIWRAYYISEDGAGVYFFWFQRTKEVLNLPENVQSKLERVAVHVKADSGEIIRIVVGSHSIEDIL